MSQSCRPPTADEELLTTDDGQPKGDQLWLEVYLRNWPALRFWTIMGFTTIVGYEGDKEPGEGKQGRLILERTLRD